jgi:hypothetical protein
MFFVTKRFPVYNGKTMSKQSLAFVNLFLVLAIFTADRFAQPYSWYWQYWWFDIIMHFTGGFFVALSALYLYFHSEYIQPRHHNAWFTILCALGAGAVIGIFWEFFEFSIDLYTERTINGISVINQKVGDTLSDLFFDMFGAVTASLIFLKLWQKK